jgi:hypothetical protein
MNVVLFKPCSADDLGRLVRRLNFSHVKGEENRLESLIQPNVSQNDVALELDQRSASNTQVQLMVDEDLGGLSSGSESALEANDTIPQWA